MNLLSTVLIGVTVALSSTALGATVTPTHELSAAGTPATTVAAHAGLIVLS